jgi:hypothetical protein
VLVRQEHLGWPAAEGFEQLRLLPLADVADHLSQQETAARLGDERDTAAPAQDIVGGQGYNRKRRRQDQQQRGHQASAPVVLVHADPQIGQPHQSSSTSEWNGMSGAEDQPRRGASLLNIRMPPFIVP